MTFLVAPERDRGLERRAARKIAGNFGDEDRGVVGKLETLARPFADALERLRVLRASLRRAEQLVVAALCARRRKPARKSGFIVILGQAGSHLRTIGSFQ